MRIRSIFKNLSFPQKRESGEKGVALLLVIGSIAMITMVAVEFTYNAGVEYHLAVRQKERLQSYYLAQSALNMTLLELKMGNNVQSQIASAQEQYNLDLGVDLSAPLCEMFPIKTGLFRLVLSSGGEAPEEKAPTSEEEEKPSLSGVLQGLPLGGLEDFLSFEGDFDATCVDESSKIDLNYFYGQNPELKIPDKKENPYDEYKKFIVEFLSLPKFQVLFENTEVRPEEAVRNIADWVDTNDLINEYGGGRSGSEESAYRFDMQESVKPKNGKFTTPQDIYRVAGIDDRWWSQVNQYFTIYGQPDRQGNPKFNLCRASDEIVLALILHYAKSREDLPPLTAFEEKDLLTLVTAAKGECVGARVDPIKVGEAVDTALYELLKISAPEPGTPGYAPQTSALTQWITDQSRFYRIRSLGQVKDTVVGIDAVIDLGEGGGTDSSKWKLLYWKVD